MKESSDPTNDYCHMAAKEQAEQEGKTEAQAKKEACKACDETDAYIPPKDRKDPEKKKMYESKFEQRINNILNSES